VEQSGAPGYIVEKPSSRMRATDQ